MLTDGRELIVNASVSAMDCLGRYSFRASTPACGALRPLRDPADAHEDRGEAYADALAGR
ncbi:hypothetical protein QF026_008569 [Streptomyces aurantiacus]|nr:hypothetical protein [Streptomyces aurantiacus]